MKISKDEILILKLVCLVLCSEQDLRVLPEVSKEVLYLKDKFEQVLANILTM